MDQDEIEGMLVANADEPFAVEIAKEIIQAKRCKQSIESTTQLKKILS